MTDRKQHPRVIWERCGLQWRLYSTARRMDVTESKNVSEAELTYASRLRPVQPCLCNPISAGTSRPASTQAVLSLIVIYLLGINAQWRLSRTARSISRWVGPSEGTDTLFSAPPIGWRFQGFRCCLPGYSSSFTPKTYCLSSSS